jgi:transposase
MADGEVLSVEEFFERFPTDDACLNHLLELRLGPRPRCPRCGKAATFRKRANHTAHDCASCGYSIDPMAGTPFARSDTPLLKWFYAMYLFAATRQGVPTKELQRQLDVPYKTAWRIGHRLRRSMAAVNRAAPLGGPIRRIAEFDQARIGGKHVKRRDDRIGELGLSAP